MGIGVEEIGISVDLIGCVSPVYSTFKINSEIIDPKFVSYYIKGELERNKRKITHRSTRREYEFETKELKKLSILIPSDINEQIAIASCLSAYDDLIHASENELLAYRRLKQCMLQKMFV